MSKELDNWKTALGGVASGIGILLGVVLGVSKKSKNDEPLEDVVFETKKHKVVKKN